MFYNGFQVFFRCFCKCFGCMFQVFHLPRTYVASVVFGCLKSRSGVASPPLLSAISPRCLLLPASAGYPLPLPSSRCWWHVRGSAGNILQARVSGRPVSPDVPSLESHYLYRSSREITKLNFTVPTHSMKNKFMIYLWANTFVLCNRKNNLSRLYFNSIHA
jgi:hypothetical protein